MKPEQTNLISTYSKYDWFCTLVGTEISNAEIKFPLFPTDPVQAVAIMIEEAGESMQAAIDLAYEHEGGSVENVQRELIQTAAMCFRAWLSAKLSAR